MKSLVAIAVLAPDAAETAEIETVYESRDLTSVQIAWPGLEGGLVLSAEADHLADILRQLADRVDGLRAAEAEYIRLLQKEPF